MKEGGLLRKFYTFLTLAVAISCIYGVIYLIVQQDLRIGANDPQIQIAEDIAHTLSQGKAISSVITSDPIDMQHSLSPFVMVFDTNGKVASTSVQLDGKVPQLPDGILQNFKTKTAEERFTWQPQSGVRDAVVIVPYNKGFVLAGRSLREVEMREDALWIQVFIGWIGTLILTAFTILVLP